MKKLFGGLTVVDVKEMVRIEKPQSAYTATFEAIKDNIYLIKMFNTIVNNVGMGFLITSSFLCRAEMQVIRLEENDG